MQSNKIPQLLVVATAGSYDTTNTPMAMANGSVGLVDYYTRANVGATPSWVGHLGSIQNGQLLMFAQSTASPNVNSKLGNKWSFPFDPASVNKVYRKNYTTQQPQITYVGFDGALTSKNLAYDCEIEYSFKVVFSSPYINKMYGNANLTRTFRSVTGCCDPCSTSGCNTANPLAETIAFVSRINTSFSYPNGGYTVPYTFLHAELIINGTFNALSNNAVVTNGSVIVTSTSHGLHPGDLVRIGGTTATYPVYVVNQIISSSQFSLTLPYYGVTGTISSANIGVMGVTPSYSIELDTIAAAGTSYVVGDVLTVAGGTIATGGTASQIQVTAINTGTGAITSAVVINPGSYSVAPSLSANAVTGGTGTGATFNLVKGAVYTSDATNYGIKLTGEFISPTQGCCCFPPYPYDAEGVTFLVSAGWSNGMSMNSWPCTFPITLSQSLSIGSGTSLELRYLEMEALGFTDLREYFKECELNYKYVSYIDQTQNYDVFYIQYLDEFQVAGAGTGKTWYTSAIACVSGSSNATTLDTQLTSLFDGYKYVKYNSSTPVIL